MKNINENWIWLDMDGTIADLYSVEGWLNCLINYDEKPYKEAKPLYDPQELKVVLMRLQEVGYRIGIISWLSKDGSNIDFNNRVIEAKRKWLKKFELDFLLDHIAIVPYGTSKNNVCRTIADSGVLVDDETQNLESWKLGGAINAKQNILIELNKLVESFL